MRQVAGRKQFPNQFVQWISANMIKVPAAKAIRSEQVLLYLIFLTNASFTEW